MESNCKYCGKIMYSKYKSLMKTYCSHKCANNDLWETKRDSAEFVYIKCYECGIEFKVFKNETRYKNGNVKYCSRKCRDLGNKSGGIKNCLQCGSEFYTTRGKFCSKKCSSDYRSEHTDSKQYYENGYLIQHIKGYNKKGNAKVHRIIAEKMIGRKLMENEVVHHINGDRRDNREENLRVMTHSEHSSLHRNKELEEGKILFESKS